MFTNCCNRRDPHPLYLLPPPAWLCICTKRIQIVLLIGWLTKSDCCNFPGKGAALKKVESETHNNRTELKAQKMKMKTRIHGLLLHRVKVWVFSMFPPSREGSTALFLCRSAWGRDISVQFSHKRWAVTRGRFFPWYIWGPADPWCFRNRKRTLHKINLGENNRVLCGRVGGSAAADACHFILAVSQQPCHSAWPDGALLTTAALFGFHSPVSSCHFIWVSYMWHRIYLFIYFLFQQIKPQFCSSNYNHGLQAGTCSVTIAPALLIIFLSQLYLFVMSLQQKLCERKMSMLTAC